MNIISKISLRKALRFFLLLAAFSVVMQFSNVSAEGQSDNTEDTDSGKDKGDNNNSNNNNNNTGGWFSETWHWVVLAIVVLLIVGGLAYFYMNRNKEEEA